MKNYLSLLQDILDNGSYRMDRTGTGTLSVFGRQLRFNLEEGFPAVTTKKLAWRAVVSELLWFIEGSGNERRLAEILFGKNSHKNTIWTDNANADYWVNKAKFIGDLGRVYGVQWRSWRTPITDAGIISRLKQFFTGKNYREVDQLANLISGIKKDPYGRRHILSAWNPGELDQMALPPCHIMCQFYVSDNKLSCHMYQRSVDTFLGLPFNIASYSLLTHMIAVECGLGVGEFVWTGGDCHIYSNHVSAVKEQLKRTPTALPKLSFIEKNILDCSYVVDDFVLDEYNPQSAIKADMAV